MKPMTWLESWFLRSGRGVLRMVAGRYFGVPQSGEPTATSEFRAALFVEPGAAGVADELKVCLKDGADAYSWVTVGVAGGVYTDEMARDAIGTALVAGNNIDITVNDPGNTITVAVETLALTDITDVTASAAELNVLDGVPATLTATELGYVDGVTSAIQTQLDAKQPLDADLTTIAGLADPNADRMLFWDDSAGAYAYLAASTGLTITTTNMTVRTASATQTGIVELATDAETTTGTDTTRAITPANFTSQIGTRVPALAHTHAAADITSGTIATARLGSGIANSSSYLRGDQTWDTIGLDELNDVTITGAAQGQLLTYDSITGWVNADPQQGIMTIDDRVAAFGTKFGSAGSSNGQFTNPAQVAIDGSGNIYVADTANNRLQKFNSSGVHQGNVTSLTGITGVCYHPGNGYIYVVYNNLLAKYNTSLSLQAGYPVACTNGLYCAGAFDTASAVYVTRTDHTIIRFTGTTSATTKTWGSNGSGPGEFSDPKGIACDRVGDNAYVYVVDQGNDRIQVFTLGGTYVYEWGHAGSDPGEFQLAHSINQDPVNGYLAVTDQTRDDVQLFTVEGAYLGVFAGPGSSDGQLQTATGLACTTAGDSWWVADDTQERLQRFDITVSSAEATRASFSATDFIVASTDNGETAFISLATPANSLATLADATIGSETDGQYLAYDGTQWVNQDLTAIDSTFRIQDNSDATKQLAYEVSGITTGTTRTWTVPDRDGTVVLSDGGVKKVLTGSVSNDPASTANGAAFAVDITVTGAAKGDAGACGHTSTTLTSTSGWRAFAPMVDTNTARCVYQNNTGGVTDPASGTAWVIVFDLT